jgi:hypothetical protein
MPTPYITQVASSVPFDPTGIAFSANDVQSALSEIRTQTVLSPEYVTTSNNATRTLTIADNTAIMFSGTGTNYTVILPDATTLFLGYYYRLYNTTAQPITIKDSGGNFLYTLSQSSVGYSTLQAQSNVSGTWIFWQSLTSLAAGAISYNLTSSTSFSTSSSTDVAITGYSLTPQAGTYAVWYSASSSNSNSTAIVQVSVYNGGTPVANSVRQFISTGSNAPFPIQSQTITQVNGSTAISIFVNTSKGTFTVTNRSLILIRLGP